MFRGKIAKRPEKGYHPTWEKTTSNLPTKESKKRKKINLHYPSPPNPPWNEINNTSSTPSSNAGPHSHRNKTKQTIKKQAKLQKAKSVTYLHYWEENEMCFDLPGIGKIFKFPEHANTRSNVILLLLQIAVTRVFFLGEGEDWGIPPSGKKFCQSPHLTLVPVFGPRLVPPSPAEVRPRKLEKFKYIFVSNLTTFKLRSTLKSCISCLK